MPHHRRSTSSQFSDWPTYPLYVKAEWSMLLSDLNLRKLQITTVGVVDVFPVSCGHNERLVRVRGNIFVVKLRDIIKVAPGEA